MSSNRIIRWGILGAGRIAHRFSASLRSEPQAKLAAISCRSAAKAAAFAEKFNVAAANALSDEALDGVADAAHEALLARRDIDAIYLALPHGLHLTWAIRALRAGKAVLCEKPAALSADEMRDIAAASRETGALFMEAMKTRFTPCYARVRELVAAGAIGRITRVETALENDMGERLSSRTDYMSDPKQGGVLLDTGIYCACWLEDYLAGVGRREDELEEQVNMGMKTIIEERYAAYIVDKAAGLGLSCAVRVTCEPDGEGLWLPVRVELTGADEDDIP